MTTEIVFPNTISLSPKYTALTTAIPTSETIALKCVPLDTDATATAEPGANTQATLYFNYTHGTETGVKIKFYDSPEGDGGALNSGNWFQEQIESDTLGVATLAAFEIDLTATAQGVYHLPFGAIRSFIVTITSYGGTNTGAITLQLGMKTN
jgi:hypothetical protein